MNNPKIVAINELAFMRGLCTRPPHVLSEPFSFADGALATDLRAVLLMKGKSGIFKPNRKLSERQTTQIASWLSSEPRKKEYPFAAFKKWVTEQSTGKPAEQLLIKTAMAFGLCIDVLLLRMFIEHLEADKIRTGIGDTDSGKRTMLVIDSEEWRLCVMKCALMDTSKLPNFPAMARLREREGAKS